jgi:hypothetical protein
MSDAELRARYTEILDAVVNDREEVVITRAGHQPGSFSLSRNTTHCEKRSIFLATLPTRIGCWTQ